MVLYRSEAAASPLAVLAELQAAPGLSARLAEDLQRAIVVADGSAGAPVEVLLAADGQVQPQAAQLAEVYGDTHPERAQIASCNQRFELCFDAPEDTVGTACLVAECLRRAVGTDTYLFDTQMGEFLLFV